MAPQSPSTSIRTGYALANLLLALSAAFGVFAIVSLTVGLARDGNSLLYGDTLSVPMQLSPTDIGPLPDNLQVSHWVDVTVVIPDPTTQLMFLRHAIDFGPIVLVILGLWLLRGFMKSVKKGDPFGPDNVRRLRGIGFVFVVGAPLAGLVDYSLRQVMFTAIPPVPEVDLGMAGYTLPVAPLLAGLGVFVLAEVFAYGQRLRDEAAATI